MSLVRDLRYAFRGLARSPLFTSVALLSIALGIGANTAIFTLVDEVLLRRLPVKDPGQLVLFNGARNHYGNNSGGNMLSFPMYEDFRDDFVDFDPQAAAPAQGGRTTASKLPRVSAPVANGAPAPKVFSGLFAGRAVSMNVGVDGQTERVPGELVSGTVPDARGGRRARRLRSRPPSNARQPGAGAAIRIENRER